MVAIDSPDGDSDGVGDLGVYVLVAGGGVTLAGSTFSPSSSSSGMMMTSAPPQAV